MTRWTTRCGAVVGVGVAVAVGAAVAFGAVALAPAAARAAAPSNPFAPGVPPQTSPLQTPSTVAPTPVQPSGGTSGSSDTGLSGSNALLIGVGALVVLAAISLFIWRDARRRAPVHARAAAGAAGSGRGPGSARARAKQRRKLSRAERRRRKRGRAR